MNYQNKVICAPMVRISSIAFRLLALDYGCDIVYSEEIIDHKLLKCKRVLNDILNTVDFIDDDQVVVFRTCSREKDRLVLQLGTNDAQRALKAAKMVEQDVSAIDVNMGCPKSFSIKGGMGAALLSQPEKVQEILSTLTANLSIPVTCKVRLLNEEEQTFKLMQLIESTGVAAITVHGRKKDERPQNPNRDDLIRKIVDKVSIPIIANGGSGNISEYKDIELFKEKTNAASVMIARAAEKNCSIFRKQGKFDMDFVIRAFLKYAVQYENYLTNVKYTVQQILGSLQETPRGKRLLSSNSVKEICDIWEMGEYFEKINQQTEQKRKALKRTLSDDEAQQMMKFKKQKIDLDPDSQCLCMRFARINPIYTCHTVNNNAFWAVCEVDGKKYISNYLEKSKRAAEQAAALVACYFLKLADEEILKECLIS